LKGEISMDRSSVVKLMHGKGAVFVSQFGERPYHSNYKKVAAKYGETPNLWMMLGQESNNLVAIALENVSPRAADCFLPQTGLIFGTQSGSRAYHVYESAELCRNRETRVGERSYVELRGEGKLLLLPSSEPVSGETLEFSSTGEPSKASPDELVHGVIMLGEFCRHGREYAKSVSTYRWFLSSTCYGMRGEEQKRRYWEGCERYFADEDPYSLAESAPDVDGSVKTSEERKIEEWLAIRKEEGRKIDPDTAEVRCWSVPAFDPYDVHDDLPEECWFADWEDFYRAPDSDIWVWEGDLPLETRKRISERPLESVSSAGDTD
jgi:hypothetical protein